MAEASDRSFSIGRILSRAFGVMGSNPLVVFGVAFALGAIPRMFFNLVFGLNNRNVAMGQTPGLLVAQGLFAILIMIVLQSIVVGCITRGAVAYSQGRRASLGECLSVAISRVFPVIAVSILFGLGVALGSILLLVPGVILAIMWSVVVPVTVEEHTGIFGAFARSRQLTSGARWNIFGLFLLLLLIMIAIGIAAGIVSLIVIGTSYQNQAVEWSPAALMLNVIFSTIISAIWSVLQTSLFVELREWKDGPIEAKLGEIFA